MVRVGFCHLICMFSLLLCQAEICGNPHQTSNKAAFKVNMLNIPVCCDCGAVCSHTFCGSVWDTNWALLVNTQELGSKERVLIRGQRSAGGLFTHLCSSQFEGRSSWSLKEVSLSILTISPLLSFSVPLEPPSRKEAVVVKHSAGFLCTSSISSLGKTATKTEVVLDIFLSIHQCVWVILQTTKHLV